MSQMSKRLVFIGSGVLGIGAVLLGIFVYWLIRSSNPPLGIGAIVPGLSHEVAIDQDGFGVPTIRGATIEDIYRGQGWVTARDRLFQMDLLRRRSAGRLAEIFGKDVLELDKFHRKLGFHKVVAEAVAVMSDGNRRLFQAYADGVNAFIRSGPLPFEIRVLGYKPGEWRPEDSLLVVLAMFLDLDFHPQYLAERALSLLYQKRPKALADFLTPITGFLDSPVLPDALSKPLEIPLANQFDIRNEPPGSSSDDAFEPGPGGSNAWALSGKFTQTGFPILAGDPHLDLFAPNIWYRARLEGGPLHVTGVSLPGLPGMVIGSNAAVAWSITYPAGDTLDLVKLSSAEARRDRREEIIIKGNRPYELAAQDTDWGPMILTADGSDYALQWTALDGKQLGQIDTTGILLSRNTSDLLEAISRWKGPVSNIVFATRGGDIGWSLAGNFPDRVGFDGRTSITRDREHYWKGYLPFEALPKVLNPPSGYIVSANQRMVPIKENSSEIIRTGNNLTCPERAFRIRQLLEESKGKWNVANSASVQLDIFSSTGAFYRDIIKSRFSREIPQGPWEKSVYELVLDWDGLVSVDTPVFPFIKTFRRQLLASLVEPLWGVNRLEETWIGGERSPMSQWYYLEPVVKALMDQKPAHLLNAKYTNYDAAISDAAVTAAKRLARDPRELKSLRWGNYNHARIIHPFSLALPSFLGRYFNMPETEIGGTLSTPKVAALLYGGFHSASMRMVVDLSDSGRSLFNQPGGQSGNFQSPHYSDQYPSWLNGTPRPFEPGKALTVDIIHPD